MCLSAVYAVYFQEQVCDAHNVSNSQGLQLFFQLHLNWKPTLRLADTSSFVAVSNYLYTSNATGFSVQFIWVNCVVYFILTCDHKSLQRP